MKRKFEKLEEKDAIFIKDFLPDWVNEKSMLFLVAGNEIVARYKYGYWEVKESRCGRCGLCCAEDGCDFLKVEHVEEDGHKVYRCANPDIPWHCVRGTGQKFSQCKVRFKKINEGN